MSAVKLNTLFTHLIRLANTEFTRLGGAMLESTAVGGAGLGGAAVEGAAAGDAAVGGGVVRSATVGGDGIGVAAVDSTGLGDAAVGGAGLGGDGIEGATLETAADTFPSGATAAPSEKDKRLFCKLNLWRIQDNSEDIKAAVTIVTKAIGELVHDFKRWMKGMGRAANTEFGGGSLKLKVFYMFSGIDNFIRHWCNDHSQCSRYCWYTTCAASMGYVFNPSKPYLNSRVSHRGPFCNQLIPLIFKVRNELLCTKE
jgi:hypothetical protein